MTTQFYPGCKVRNKPANGKFEIFIVEGFILGQVEVRSTSHKSVETEFYFPDQLELFEFTSSNGTYQIGDTVRLFGVDGNFEAISFYRNDDDDVVVKLKGDVEYLAHFAKKVSVH